MLEICGLSFSLELVSAVTDAVRDDVSAWQSRQLETTCAIAFSAWLWIKIREERTVRSKAVSLVIGARCSGHKEILGLWIEPTEGANFCLRVMPELKARGTQDMLIVFVDGLKGFGEVTASVFRNPRSRPNRPSDPLFHAIRVVESA